MIRFSFRCLAFAAGLSLTCLTGGAMAQNPIDTIRPDAPELAAFGDIPVGVQTLRLSNPAQIDILNVTEDATPTYNRPLLVEVWYPAVPGTEAGTSYQTVIRDGQTETILTGRANRDAAPAELGRYPLVILSHGYPGNRFLMSHLGENLASKGYVTVSIDHTDSTYSDQGAFGSTLLNRPLDQRFVVDQMAALEGPLGAIIDADNVGVIGYSMGGYGAFKLALNHPDRYAAAASLSGALDPVGLLNEMPERADEWTHIFGDPPRVEGTGSDLFAQSHTLAERGHGRFPLYACCGTGDFIYHHSTKFRDHANAVGLNLTYEEHVGQEHEWGYWDQQIQRVLEWLPWAKQEQAER